MRPVGFRAVLLAIFCLATALPAAKLWAVENGCPGTPCSGSDSGCATSSFSNVIDQICSLAPSGDCVGRCACCRAEIAEPFAGVTFGSPAAAPPTWPGIGGRGQLAGETELCLLRDIGALPGAAFMVPPAPISLGPLGEAKVRQRVGFLSFDPVARAMRGYHGVSVCVPPFGCVDDQVQTFTAALLDAPAAAGLHCGDYPFARSFGLEIATSDSERRLDVDLPAIEVYTPYGVVSATPKFHYETALKSGNPTDPNHDRRDECSDVGSTLFPLDGRAPGADGLNFLCALLPRPLYEPGYGTTGQLALGSRDADPSGALYAPGTPRPDLDLSVARTAEEKIPVGGVGASARFTYDVAGLVPEKFRTSPFSLQANVFVEPGIDTRFASQFQVHGSDAYHQLVEIVPDCTNGNYPLAGVDLRSRAESFVSFGVDAGFNLVLKLRFSVAFGTITATVLEKHPKFDVVPEFTDESAAEGPVAGARFVDSAVPGFASLTSFSAAGPEPDPLAFIEECFTAPPPAEQTPPTPTFTPDDPRKLTQVLEFPCNLCLGWGSLSTACGPKEGFPSDYPCDFTDGICTDPAGHGGCTSYPVPASALPTGAANAANVLFPALQQDGATWLCDSAEKVGCMDLCTYDPTAAQPLQVVRSALELEPERCGTTTVSRVCTSDDACDDGNPCTLDSCSGGEIGYCQYGPQDGACDDGLHCNGADQCALGACALHAGNPCTGSAADCCSESTDSCVETCPAPGPRCGNDLVQPGEACDDGNLVGGDGCSPTCETECGNGTTDPGETCDDGNTADGDGCSAACRTEGNPDCGTAFATTTELWPPNHHLVSVSVSGVSDASGDPVTIAITGVRQDEPIDGLGDGDACPDAEELGSATARLRAERAGTARLPGDGRVYHVGFTAADSEGRQCTGTVSVCVPHDQKPGHGCVDQGPLHDSTAVCPP